MQGFALLLLRLLQRLGALFSLRNRQVISFPGVQASSCSCPSVAPLSLTVWLLSSLGSYLVLVQLTVLVLLLSLLLEGDDDETHEDVHHEEGDDDDVDDEEDGDLHAVVVDGAFVFCVGVDGAVQQPGGGDRPTEGTGEAGSPLGNGGADAPRGPGLRGAANSSRSGVRRPGSSPSSAVYWPRDLGQIT